MHLVHDDYITATEFVWLIVFLGAPVILSATAGQVAYLRRRGFARKRRLLAMVASLTIVASYGLTPVLWALVPSIFLDWPGSFGDWPFMVGGVFFVPSILAAVAVVPLITWVADRWGSAGPSAPSRWDSARHSSSVSLVFTDSVGRCRAPSLRRSVRPRQFLNAEAVAFSSQSGSTIHGWLSRPPDARGSVLLLPGAAARTSSRRARIRVPVN